MSDCFDVCSTFSFRTQFNSGASTSGVFWEVWDVFALFKLQVSHTQCAPRMQRSHMLHFKIHIPWCLLLSTHICQKLSFRWCEVVIMLRQQKNSMIDNYFPKPPPQMLSVSSVNKKVTDYLSFLNANSIELQYHISTHLPTPRTRSLN